MSELNWARSTMALSLGFHIVFASISMVLPFYMAWAHHRFLKDGDETYLRLTQAWSKGTAILFATGAVSGTALSFQLGLLWPGFMVHAGPIIGMPFSLEGAAFFLEAIFLGLFLYGWKKLPPKRHFWTGVAVGICGLSSGILVIAANGFMNAPTGFDWVDGGATNIDPWRAMFNEAWPLMAVHMVVAAFQATGCVVAGVHAFGLLSKNSAARQTRDLHRAALSIVLPLTVGASLLQPVIGDLSAKAIAERQPEKLAAVEAHYKTGPRAGLWVGGLVDEQNETVSYGIQIPGALSFLAHGDIDAEVTGLHEFPPDERPPVAIVHIAFQIMIGIGTLLAGGSIFYLAARRWRPAWIHHRRFLLALIACTPLGFIALEAGWVVTEVGRQPWVLYRILKTADSVTPVPGQAITFFSILSIYALLGTLSLLALARIYQIETAPARADPV